MVIRNLAFVFIVVFLNVQVFGQKVTYNHIVNSSDIDTIEVMNLLENYFASNPQNKLKNSFWNSFEQEKHKNFDFLETEFQPSLYMGFPIHILSIKSNNKVYEIKAQFSYTKDDGTPYILAIVNYVAKKENGKYKLYNWLTENKHSWNCTTVGMVDFYYPPYHDFDYKKADRLNEFIFETSENLGLNPTPFEYYLADDFDEIQRLKGIDYYIGMGGENIPRGKATDDKAYCGGLGEFYPHEVVHVLMDKQFPNTHAWVSEGLATFLGGSRGHTLKWHIIRTNKYLKDHPELNLSDMLKLTNLDNQTAFHYVLGGLIVQKIYEKGGWSQVRDFMSIGATDEEYYTAIENQLGVKKSDLNTYIRNQLDLEARK